MSAHASPLPHSVERALRGWFRFLGVWNVCDNVACRRALACRGNMHVCGHHTFHRLPSGARDWFLAYLCCKDEGLTFDQTMKRINKMPFAEGFAEWYETLPRAEGKPRRFPDRRRARPGNPADAH